MSADRTAGGEPLLARFAADHITELRHRVAGYCVRAGLAGQRLDDFVLAVYELLTNAVRHGGGGGHLRLWSDGETVNCEVGDTGNGFAGPAVTGMQRPTVSAPGGLGIWLTAQLTDAMSVRSSDAGTVVHVQVRIGSR